MIGCRFPHVLKAAADSDEAAFGLLWQDLQPRPLRYFTVTAPAAAEGLASRTWLDVVGGLSRFRGSEPAFQAWVFTIARHRVLDWRRPHVRDSTRCLPGVEIMEWTPADDPAATVVEGISTRAALDLVATLPTDQAEAITLRVVAGLDIGQVAEVMGKSRAWSGCSSTGACADWPSGSVLALASPGWDDKG
jgi:RNA polymerase sigma-70 factor (ECF subfamily)